MHSGYYSEREKKSKMNIFLDILAYFIIGNLITFGLALITINILHTPLFSCMLIGIGILLVIII